MLMGLWAQVKKKNSVCASLTHISTSLPGVFPPKSPTQPIFDRRELKELIRSRRPSDPSLYCCDYNTAEAEDKKGIPGKPDLGGHTYATCAGVWSIWRIGTTAWKTFP